MKDTAPGIEAKFRELMMSRSPSERLAMACRMFEAGKSLIQAGILQEYGKLPPNELRRRTFLRLYAQDFAQGEKEQIAKWLADA